MKAVYGKTCESSNLFPSSNRKKTYLGRLPLLREWRVKPWGSGPLLSAIMGMYANWLKRADCNSVGVERPRCRFESYQSHKIHMGKRWLCQWISKILLLRFESLYLCKIVLHHNRRMLPPCHGGDCGFESRQYCKYMFIRIIFGYYTKLYYIAYN